MPDVPAKSKNKTREEYDVISNQISVSLARRESLIKSWTASSSHSLHPVNSQNELDAEDATLSSSQPLHLGLGAPISSKFLMSDAERNNNSLRAKLFGSRSIIRRKAESRNEKITIVKNQQRDDSSDDELGRSSIGKAKKSSYQSPLEKSMQTGEISDNMNGNSHNKREDNKFLNRIEPVNSLAVTEDESDIVEKKPLQFGALEQNITENHTDTDKFQIRKDLAINPHESRESKLTILNIESPISTDRITKRRKKKAQNKKRRKMKVK